jgi:phage baseplate assembly protein W
MKTLSFPYRIDQSGRTASLGVASGSPATSQAVRTGDAGDAEVRELIEQLLFVVPGERIMRPTLGSGVGQLVFAPASEAMAATAQHLVQGALQTWLGDRILVESVDVEAEESRLSVSIRYRPRISSEARTVVVSGQV